MKDDYYTYDEENYQYTGKDTGKVYRLGDPVKVKILRVSVPDRKADFVFV
jgi:ribonuclease R